MKKTICCLRCGKREGFRKSHEKIRHKDNVIYLCVDCAQIAYKMKDAITEKNRLLAGELANEFELLPKSTNEVLGGWFDEYKTRIGFLTSPEDKCD